MPSVIPPDTQNYPYIKSDALGNAIQESAFDLAFQGDYVGGVNLIYQGFARPGSATSAAVWQIAKHTYDANNNILTTTWPQNTNGIATAEYYYIWDNRATYTYS